MCFLVLNCSQLQRHEVRQDSAASQGAVSRNDLSAYWGFYLLCRVYILKKSFCAGVCVCDHTHIMFDRRKRMEKVWQATKCRNNKENKEYIYIYLYICIYLYHTHRIGGIRRRSTCSKQIHHICLLGAYGPQWPLNFIGGILKNLNCPNLLTGGVFETNHLEARLKLGDFRGKAPAVSRTNPASRPSDIIFLPNCPFGYILVKLYLPQNSWGSSTSLARRFFFRQIGWKIWRLGVWADAKQLPFIATCDSVTPWLVAFFSQGWRSSMAWTAQVPLFLVFFLLFPFIPVDGRNPKQPPGMGLKA